MPDQLPSRGPEASGDQPDPADFRRILEERARRTARRPAAPDAGALMTVLAFTIGGSEFAVESRHVLEVCEPTGLTAIPCTPGFISGVIALRGRIVAVVDLAALFGLVAVTPTSEERVVVLRGGAMEFGLRVHAVHGVQRVPAPAADSSLAAFAGAHERFFLGISGQELAVLDGERLLADDALKVSGPAARQLPALPVEG